MSTGGATGPLATAFVSVIPDRTMFRIQMAGLIGDFRRYVSGIHRYASPINIPVRLSMPRGATAQIASLRRSLTGGINLGGRGSGLGMLGAGMGLYAVAGQIKKTIDIGADFERKMLEVKGVMELTGADGEKQFQQLTQAAKNFSKESLGFGPTAVADTFKELAEKGWTPNQILASTPALLDLAAINHMKLSKAAEITGSVLNAFQMDASKAGEVTDILQGGANKTSANIDYLGESLRNSSGLAKTMGMELSDLVALTGALSQSGIRASESGYTLSRMFQRLINPTSKGTKGLESINKIFEITGEKRSDFFAGNTLRQGKGMDFMSLLQRYKGKVTPERFSSDFIKIFGEKGSKLLQTFSFKDQEGKAKTGIDAILKARDEINAGVRGPGKKGVVEKQAETVAQGLDVNIEKMAASIERLRVSLVTGITPELVKIVQLLTQATDWFTRINDETDGAFSKILLFGAGVATVGTTIRLFLPAIKGVGLALRFLTIGPVGFLLATITAAAFIFKDEFVLAIQYVIAGMANLSAVVLRFAATAANAFAEITIGAQNRIAEAIITYNPLLSEPEKRQQLDVLREDQVRAARLRAAQPGFLNDTATKAEANASREQMISEQMDKAYQKKKAEQDDKIKAAENKMKAGVPPGGTESESGSIGPEDPTKKPKKSKSDKSDRLEVVGITELHNKIQTSLLDKDKYARQTAENTKVIADRMGGGGQFNIPAGGVPQQGGLFSIPTGDLGLGGRSNKDTRGILVGDASGENLFDKEERSEARGRLLENLDRIPFRGKPTLPSSGLAANSEKILAERKRKQAYNEAVRRSKLTDAEREAEDKATARKEAVRAAQGSMRMSPTARAAARTLFREAGEESRAAQAPKGPLHHKASNQTTPFQRKMAALDAAIAEKGGQARTALSRAAAFLGMSKAGKAPVGSDQSIKLRGESLAFPGRKATPVGTHFAVGRVSEERKAEIAEMQRKRLKEKAEADEQRKAQHPLAAIFEARQKYYAALRDASPSGRRSIRGFGIGNFIGGNAGQQAAAALNAGRGAAEEKQLNQQLVALQVENNKISQNIVKAVKDINTGFAE